MRRPSRVFGAPKSRFEARRPLDSRVSETSAHPSCYGSVILHARSGIGCRPARAARIARWSVIRRHAWLPAALFFAGVLQGQTGQGSTPPATPQPEMTKLKSTFIPGDETIFLDDFSDMPADSALPPFKVGETLGIAPGNGSSRADGGESRS